MCSSSTRQNCLLLLATTKNGSHFISVSTAASGVTVVTRLSNECHEPRRNLSRRSPHCNDVAMVQVMQPSQPNVLVSCTGCSRLWAPFVKAIRHGVVPPNLTCQSGRNLSLYEHLQSVCSKRCWNNCHFRNMPNKSRNKTCPYKRGPVLQITFIVATGSGNFRN